MGEVRRKALRPKVVSATLPALKAPRLLDQLRERIRFRHYSRSTEDAYVFWVRTFIRHHGLRHPRDLDGAAVESFLTWLASERQVAPATHRRALSALLFLYGKVLGVQLPWMSEIGRPRPQRRLPVVMSRDEVVNVLSSLDLEWRLFGQLLYGTGMRITEGLRLRVKDVDFSHGAIIVREGIGGAGRPRNSDRGRASLHVDADWCRLRWHSRHRHRHEAGIRSQRRQLGTLRHRG
ncbi:integrase [Paucibacter sp. KBW04]|nr:integrase [Paucibacter sp. KBW04]